MHILFLVADARQFEAMSLVDMLIIKPLAGSGYLGEVALACGDGVRGEKS